MKLINFVSIFPPSFLPTMLDWKKVKKLWSSGPPAFEFEISWWARRTHGAIDTIIPNSTLSTMLLVLGLFSKYL